MLESKYLVRAFTLITPVCVSQLKQIQSKFSPFQTSLSTLFVWVIIVTTQFAWQPNAMHLGRSGTYHLLPLTNLSMNLKHFKCQV